MPSLSIPTLFLILASLLTASAALARSLDDAGVSRHSSSVANRAFIIYTIPDSNPTIDLTFTTLARPTSLLPITTLLGIIEQLPTLCSADPTTVLPSSSGFSFGEVTFVIKNYGLGDAALLYRDACTIMRGLAEYMSYHLLFREAKCVIRVAGKLAGYAQLKHDGGFADGDLPANTTSSEGKYGEAVKSTDSFSGEDRM